MSGRLIVLSNRIPTDAKPSGGLVVALHDCLSEAGGVWIGSSAEPQQTATDTLSEIGNTPYWRLGFDLTHEEHEGFYHGYSNSVLWPLLHHRSDLMEVNAKHAETYLAVNARVARMLAKVVRDDDLIWVHDYHFLPIAVELRRLGVKNRIGFFLHTPFPLATDLLALPERHLFPVWIAAFDLVGLQTKRDIAALLDLFRSDPKGELLLDGTVRHGTARFKVQAFPIGIDVDDFIALADRSVGKQELDLSFNQKLVIGVDRLDYSKGLVNRFKAFGAYLEQRRPDEPRATFLQIAPASRAELDAYQDIRSELEETAGRVNGAYASIDWTPIRYIRRAIPRETIAGLYRCADIGLVTPLADGMNLVAKEYVAAQDPDDPGVLILSHFAGAAEQLTDALIVNPFDISELANAIRDALVMPLDERKARHAAMMAVLRKEDIAWWSRNFLRKLSAALPAKQSELI